MYREEELQKTDSLKEKIALYSNAEYLKNLLDSCEVEKCAVKAVSENGETVYKLSAECKQEIGELKEIYIEKNGDNA